jgi:hypothetical protein
MESNYYDEIVDLISIIFNPKQYHNEQNFEEFQRYLFDLEIGFREEITKNIYGITGYFEKENLIKKYIINISEWYFNVLNSSIYDDDENENDDDNQKLVMPDIKKGQTEDIQEVISALKLKHVKGDPDSQRANIEVDEDIVTLTDVEIQNGIVPNVQGMGARSAIYLMENAGLQVRVTGIGKVKKQSLQAGQNIAKNTTIVLELS